MSATAYDLRNIPASARKKLPKSDFAGPGTSYPIAKPADVAAAAKLIGKADNPDAVKRKIISIAKRKGPAFVAQLPKAWTSAAKDAALSPFVSRIELADAVADQPRSSWAQLLRTGTFSDPRYGEFSITRADLSTMAANFATKYPVDPTRLAIDYNHGTSRPSSPAEGKAAGWIQNVELRADGDELWGQIEWTEQAASMIEAKEYQFVSATFSFDYTNSNGGEALGPTLLAAAMTNRPVVHGMQPLSLSHKDAVKLADAPADDDEEAEKLFSFDEQRRRVQAALAAAYGVRYSYGGMSDYTYGGIYLEALFDDLAVYSEPDGDKFQVGYAIAADGTVSFTSEPVEVRVSYEPLTAEEPAEELPMSTIKTKDAAGKDVELSEATVIELAKKHGPQPTAPVELAALRETVETQGAKIVELQTRNEAMDLAIRTKNAEAEFDVLLRAGKVDPKQRETLVKLALAHNEMFKELTATMPVVRAIGTVTGSDADVNGTSPQDQLTIKAKEIRAGNPKLSEAGAMDLAVQQNPDLYKAADAAYLAKK